MMTRQPNWHIPLDAYIEAQATQKFAYGVLDCGLFVAGAIEAMTGVNLRAELRLNYRTRKAALQLVRSLCGKSSIEALAGYVATRYEIAECSIHYAQRGDVVLLHKSRLGIVSLLGTDILTPTTRGLIRLPLFPDGLRDRATRAWHI